MATTRRVALLFPGQGSQYPRMAAGLYGQVEVFTDTMDQAFESLGHLGVKLRDEWRSERPGALFDDVVRAQPLLYAVEYALGRTVLDWGVRPAAMLGHSVGEMVAATLSGVLSFSSGLRLMLDRVEQYAATPPGGMLAVAASAADVTAHLTGTLAIAAVNAEQQTVVAGERAELAALTRTLRDRGFTCVAVRANQAFHSPVVAGAARRSVDAWSAVSLRPPHTRLYSARLGAVLGSAAAVDPAFWAMQPAAPVLFWPTLDLLLRDESVLLVEVGPGQGLITLARRHPALQSGHCDAVGLLPARAAGPDAELAALRAAADRLAADGHIRPGAAAPSIEARSGV
ncbi:acyltransferase domain-containing protein [Streptosporangiaceae bacterium NEAU-GS5]|nr:acyltransferase domain-containing protein [Streptosporangiaceae bacterium NEAU-GS5]